MNKYIAVVVSLIASTAPAFSMPSNNLALVKHRQMSIFEAKAAAIALSNEVRRDPCDLIARRSLVEALIQMGRSEQAAREMQILVRFGMRAPEDFCLLADAYRYAGKTSSAIQNYQESLNINPLYAHARAGMAICYMHAGFPKTGEKICKEALSMTIDREGRHELKETLKTIRTEQEAAAAAKTFEIQG